MSKVKLELPFMMNVLLYIQDFRTVTHFFQVSKKCQESGIGLRVNPLFDYSVVRNNVYYSYFIVNSNDHVRSFIDKLFLYFPNIETLQLHPKQLTSLTEEQFNKVERIRVNFNNCFSLEKITQKWGSKLTSIKMNQIISNNQLEGFDYSGYQKANTLQVEADCINETILKMQNLNHLIIFVESETSWLCLKDILQIIRKGSFRVSVIFGDKNKWGHYSLTDKDKSITIDTIIKTFPLYHFFVKNTRLYPIECYPFFPIESSSQFDYSKSVITKHQEWFNEKYLPTKLKLAFGSLTNEYFGCAELNVDLTPFNCLTSLEICQKAKSYTLPNCLKRLKITGLLVDLLIPNIDTVKVTSLRVFQFMPFIDKMKYLQELKLDKVLCKFISPTTLTKLVIKNKFKKEVILNSGLKELSLPQLPGKLIFPSSLTSLTTPYLLDNGINNCYLQSLSLGNLSYLIDSMIPKTVTQISCGIVESISLTKTTQLKELFFVLFVKRKKYYLNKIDLPSSINQLTIWVNNHDNIDINQFRSDMGDYFVGIKSLILDGDFIDDLLTFDE
ncbi:hypothetical protein EHI8A_183010 [Entamoeba histolytica HM-1:IMSS-B]|uniref:Uncharacterized protein n=6 Tax=Entamoeba histolytica TaxID=5759 RepID=C4MAA4_ENTH1|nr:hypothetical protein EHI_003250 [Entamoeba histolytica HM-1:IMSS]EMD45792.1 Hypothetical protein EHI5A_136570 [Entamoeba histolytica KU27]EMH74811.1 hypothetical protein EHI8A_183010 [Entamoeba histolytica HM-1:IMSS-B]EMS11865.1 hypothetical protein KM1_169210 [Entamoeba histolytica HM-3:IMSS]ENY63764.1 hypothetical protein EHI7A_100540 [Entamoeba histolytica HM-1:IMSS-A]GAT98703.1 hypothetical protein CL6EHI_003250 [Entamoeba histolytica]|eukprot:XP_649321.1 hypothetical protein EHI_003250 [Entamoeba histolytica HM-1:IMSS]